MPAAEINQLSVCAWREGLLKAERPSLPQEELEDLLTTFVSYLDALDQAVMEMAYGLNGVPAAEDISLICEEQDLPPAAVLMIIQRSHKEIEARFLTRIGRTIYRIYRQG